LLDYGVASLFLLMCCKTGHNFAKLSQLSRARQTEERCRQHDPKSIIVSKHADFSEPYYPFFFGSLLSYSWFKSYLFVTMFVVISRVPYLLD